MKKLLLFLAIALLSIPGFSQVTVYENNFDSDGAEGWAFIDNDGNTMNWSVKNNEYSTYLGGAAFNVLGSLQTGGAVFDNWAILPVQDLSQAIGVALNLTYLYGFFECENLDYLEIYAGTSANIQDLLANGIVATVVLEGDTQQEPPLPVTKTVEIPAEYNLRDMHIAIVHRVAPGDPFSFNWAVEITEVSITAETLSTTDFSTDSAIVSQNPAGDVLLIKSTGFRAQTASVTIYDSSGNLIKKAPFEEQGTFVGDLPGGLYFVSVSDGNNNERLKFLKK